jgi:uncharacterized protein (TIGR03663 family)
MENAVPRSRWVRWFAFILVALLGLAVRLPQLSVRPMHTDEAVNGYIVGQLLAGETFAYDSRDRHGPALAAVALPLARLQGAKSFSDLTESQLRMTSVMAGTVTILVFGAAAEMFGFVPCLIAAVLFAFGPLPVYYDRYFIHESLFCAATFGLIVSGWRAINGRSAALAALAGACAAVMLAGKETAVLHFFALGVAVVGFALWSWRGESFRGRNLAKTALAALVYFVVLLLLLYTWFGRDWKAIPTLLYAAPHLLQRAGGQGHEKPFWYFARLLTGGWSGGVVVALACIGLVLSILKRNQAPYFFLAIYSVTIAAIYSAIPYKTPWLALNLWLPAALFAGLSVQWIWSEIAKRVSKGAAIPAFTVVAGLVAALIAHDTRERVFRHPADESNPYAYAHTTEDILGLAPEIMEMAQQDGIAKPRIAVIASDPWPLPWYLRHFSDVGFWQPGQAVAKADFYVTSTEAAQQYGNQLRDDRADFFGERPGVLILLWLPMPK